MGQIERLKRITKGRIEAFLDSLEKPEVVFPQLVKELSAKVKEAANAEAKALTAVKADQRRLDEATGMKVRFEKGAVLAYDCDDIDTAKQAISAQIRAEKRIKSCKKSLERSESAYSAARQVRIQLQDNLKDLKARKKQILSRQGHVQLRGQVQSKVDSEKSYSSKSIMDAVARMEAKVELEESRSEVQNEVLKTLGSGFDSKQGGQIEDESEVERRLKELKEKHGK